MTVTLAKEKPPTQQHPITFRLPRPGVPDPYFNLSRSFYYALEQRGLLKLVRIRDKGKERGVTLIPYADVEAFVRAQMEGPQ
jgi:hypothetical protein